MGDSGGCGGRGTWRKANDTGCKITTVLFEIDIPCHPLRVSQTPHSFFAPKIGTNNYSYNTTNFRFELNIPCHPLRVSSDGRPNSPEGGGMVC